MRRLPGRALRYLALVLAFAAGGCASLDERTAEGVVPPIDTGSGRTGGGDGGRGGGY